VHLVHPACGEARALRRRTLLRLAAAGLLAPTLPRSAAAATRLGTLQTRMPFWGSAGTSGGGFTLTGAFTAETPFHAVQLFWTNFDTVPRVVSAAAAAPSATLGDAANPVNAAGTPDATLLRPVTFSGQRSGTVPAAVQGTTGRFHGNDRVAGLLVSDVMPIASLPRGDGALPLLFTRSFSAGPMSCAVAGGVLGQYPPGGGAFDLASNGRIVRTGAIGGDCASAPGLVQASPNEFLAPTGVIFHTTVPGLSLMAGGDSLFQGYGTATMENDPFHIAACALSRPSLPITVCKLAYQGMSSASFQANLAQMVAAARPSVAFIKGESPNDLLHGTQAGYSASLGGLVALGAWCANLGVTPVASTAMPFNETLATDAVRQQFNARIRSSGWYYTDFDAAVSDGAVPAQIRAELDSFTLAPHPNDAGDCMIASSVETVLRRIIADGVS
jgi:hypothetical protein